MDETINKEKTSNIINSINSTQIPSYTNEDQIGSETKEVNENKEVKLQNNISNQNNSSENSSYFNSNVSYKAESKHKKKEQKGWKDIAFKFPIEKCMSKVAIPCSFQQTVNSKKSDNYFHSYITIKDTPKLYIDISNDEKMDKFLLVNTKETLKSSNQKLEGKLQNIDTNIVQYENENDSLREEIKKLHQDLINCTNNINHLKTSVEKIRQNNNIIIDDMNNKIKEKTEFYENLQKNYELIQNEIKNDEDYKNKDSIMMKIKHEINIIQEKNYNNLKYYTNKFIKNEIIPDELIHQSLQKDIIDFMNFVSNKINKIKPRVNELINLIQNSVEKSIGEKYEVKLYGSYATGLCLPWSDIDVVLCLKNSINDNNTKMDDNLYVNKYMPLHELFTYLQKNNDFKSINYIGATTIPLIKIKTKDNIDIKNVDISLQDNSHYGIKCVSLVLSFVKEYDVLLPMVLALKNILKQANLNDPYTVSIYIIIYRED